MGQLAPILEILHRSLDAFRSLHAIGTSSRSNWELWWAGPRRVRQQYGGNLIVVDGPWWWFKHRDGKVISNEDNSEVGVGLGPGIEILHGRDLLGDVLLQFRDQVRVAARDAALLHAIPRYDDDGSRWWDYREPFEVVIDAQTGVILRTPHVRVNDISYDETFADELFSPPPRKRRWRR